MKNKFDTEYIDERIEAKLISKIAHHRLKIRDLMRNRHKADYPELHYISVKGSIRNLRVWKKMAYLIDEAKYRMPHNPVEPYPVYMATKLTTV